MCACPRALIRDTKKQYNRPMKKNILITGMPKSGKSTLLRKLITDIPRKVGFVTNEVLGENGRVGFEIETSIGHKVTLAHVGFKTGYQVSKYFVDTGSLGSVIPEVSNFENDSFLYLDEIGQMQLLSEKFKGLVTTYLESPNTCLMTISCVYENDFTERIKGRNDIILVEISAENREEREVFVSQLLNKIEKAKGYICEPERFKIEGLNVELKSEHGTRSLVFVDGRWNCTCDFFRRHEICSHAIATDEIVVK